ncbi:iron transporter [Halocalculus aciditolerans]|uniref:Iron transporter n=1 Tax=Halocalculus aciditolerans TaxID=1383812 RepID=A0A830FF62_9EURY|nr:iron transporter [Halocalculus aciditolerans]GGL68629.1 iron transporter [Halocalculus aciditolerans]
MRRRRLLGALSAAGAAGLAGCTDLFDLRPSQRAAPPLVEDRPDAVYYPTHVEGMQMSGMAKASGYACAFAYTYPHRFWLLTGTHTNTVEIADDDTMHVMPVVWHAASGRMLTDVSLNVTAMRDGEEVVSNRPWPMLSQPMGWHFGDNVSLPGDGTYDVTVDVGEPATRRTGALRNPPSLSFDFTLDYSTRKLNEVSFTRLSEKQGTRGAVDHMEMGMLPSSRAPAPSALPGTALGSASTGDAVVVATVLDDATRFGGSDSQSYLAVSPRTPYNRYPLPRMGLSATIAGETRDLTETLDPALGSHYGVVLDAPPRAVTLHVDTPPQFARHEGYETAFIEMPDRTLGE